MYTKTVPFKDYNDKPRNSLVRFNLETHEVFQNMVSLNTILNWTDSLKGQDRDLTPEEMVEFFNCFETVLLNAWGILSDDGLQFSKTGKYEFAESKLYAACMEMFVTDIGEVQKLLAGILPEGMDDIIRKQTESMTALAAAPGQDPAIAAEIVRLQTLQAERVAATPSLASVPNSGSTAVPDPNA